MHEFSEQIISIFNAGDLSNPRLEILLISKNKIMD